MHGRAKSYLVNQILLEGGHVLGICRSRVIVVTTVRDFLTQHAIETMGVERGDEGIHIVLAVAPDQMALGVAIVDRTVAKCGKPVLERLTRNTHCGRINHRLQIRTRDLIDHALGIVDGRHKVALLGTQALHR